jgi:hypothetical protein
MQIKKLSNLTKAVGAFALGALVMTGCKSKEADSGDGGGDAATSGEGGDSSTEGESGSCGGEGKEGSCGGGDGSCGGK